jgi:periplasmic protein TonB
VAQRRGWKIHGLGSALRVRAQVVVDDQGRPQNLKVLRSLGLGLGLDQKAIEAVSQWRFKPGLKDGKPVPVLATIEVNFRLLTAA